MEKDKLSKTEQYALYSTQNLQTIQEFEELMVTRSVTPEAVEKLFQVMVRLEEMIDSPELDETNISKSKQIRNTILRIIARALNTPPDQQA